MISESEHNYLSTSPQFLYDRADLLLRTIEPETSFSVASAVSGLHHKIDICQDGDTITILSKRFRFDQASPDYVDPGTITSVTITNGSPIVILSEQMGDMDVVTYFEQMDFRIIAEVTPGFTFFNQLTLEVGTALMSVMRQLPLSDDRRVEYELLRQKLIDDLPPEYRIKIESLLRDESDPEP